MGVLSGDSTPSFTVIIPKLFGAWYTVGRFVQPETEIWIVTVA